MGKVPYEENCIHLHACRRIAKAYGNKKAIGCDSEMCNAYQDVKAFCQSNGLYTHDQVEYVMRRSHEDCVRGYDIQDCMVEDYTFAGDF